MTAEVPIDYDYLFKFLFLGDSGVGKTSFLYGYTQGTFKDTRFIATVGIDFRIKRLLYKPKIPEGTNARSKKICLQLWDTSGQERYRSLTNAFFRDTMGFILMFDITSESSFLNLQNWIEQLRTHGYTDSPPCVICGNKSDLFDKRVVSKEKACYEAQKYGYDYVETSAETGHNVDKAMEILLDLVIAKMQKAIEGEYSNRLNDFSSNRIRLQNFIADKSSCSC